VPHPGAFAATTPDEPALVMAGPGGTPTGTLPRHVLRRACWPAAAR
jgi:hypothetical protein